MLQPSKRYHEALQAGALKTDAAQAAHMPLFDALHEALLAPARWVPYKGVQVWRYGANAEALAPVGLYVYGPVGRGKSMLMQLLFESVPFQEKRRVHFHAFMEELHTRLHQAKPPQGVDMMRFVASEIAKEARLLCFDEFYVTNIADAMMLGRLLEALFFCGVTLCATSNWAPKDLYQDGYNRSRFMPFMALLQKQLQPLRLDDGADWRTQEGGVTLVQDADVLFTQKTGVKAQAGQFDLGYFQVPYHGLAQGVLWCDFEALFAQPFGRGEYLQLVEQCQMLILSCIPRLTADKADVAMRFIVCVDIFYEQNKPLLLDTKYPLHEICAEGAAAFAFERTLSRLAELSRQLG